MSIRRKLGSWLNLLLDKKRKITSSFFLKVNCTSSVFHAGKNPGESEHQSNTSYFNSIYTCPLSVYIDVTCDNKLESLVISGRPTTAQLEEARLKLMSEFYEASDNASAQMFSETSRNLFAKRNRIIGLEASLRLILAKRYEYSIIYLNKNGVKCSWPESDEDFKKLVSKINIEIKNSIIKLKIAQAKYDSLHSCNSEKPNRKYYNKLLIILSTCDIIKIQLNPKKMMVSEFAEYLNLYNEYKNYLKMKRNGKH